MDPEGLSLTSEEVHSVSIPTVFRRFHNPMSAHQWFQLIWQRSLSLAALEFLPLLFSPLPYFLSKLRC